MLFPCHAYHFSASTMNNIGEGKGISPVRTKSSKLKKRRRQRESEASTCSLQSVPAAATTSSLIDRNKKQSNNDLTTKNESTAGAAGSDAQCTSILQKENNSVVVSKPTSLSDRNKGLTDPSRRNNNLISLKKAHVIKGERTTSKLSFIDEMDPTQLSNVGKDVMASFMHIDVTSELERAFAPSSTDIFDTTDKNNVFYHDLIGRIGPLDIGDNDEAFSIAFPQCKIPKSSNARVEGPSISTSLQTINLKRQTCYGMSIPMSWCQFPGPNSEQSNTKENADTPIAVDVTDPIDSATSELVIEEEDIVSSPSLQYQGRIRISSDKGATIREVFDIDESDYVIGKLSQGDERYFIEKKMLPAPPPDSDDDESDSDDEDCVAVVRYKIVLNEHDCIGCSHEFVERDTTSGKMVGWISDRGRLANDPYFILKELDE
eukprot:scaffold6557_cov109-Skeletonema_dohrnii-CCMP3373.AAC.3